MKNFKLTKNLYLEELNLELKELVHEPSQAEIVHLGCEDPENVFCISFRTLPESSNGVAHILEHVVLCGSENYPVRDPFFAMTRRSLNTYMNALTGSDFTCYPAASQVKKDFYNLLSVYLDAVFRPKLDRLSFLQEGHRLDLTETDQLEFKGVVYNEMKGALTNPHARLWNRCMEALFPTLTYRVESGGDPKVIPELTYEEFLEFYQQHYHPSRCIFYFYGNLPLEEHLRYLETHLLNNVTLSSPLPPLPKEVTLKKVEKKECFYPVSPGEAKEDQAFITIGWLTCSISEQEELLALQVLESILMGTDAGLLKHPLLQSGLCKQVSVYLDSDMSEIPLILVFKGCKGDALEKISSLVFSTLREICSDPIPSHLIEAAIHQLEMDRCEINGDYGPYGLTLFLRSVLLKQQGGEIEKALLVHSLFDHLRETLKDPTYLHSLIKKYFLNNRHQINVVMRPSETLADEEEEEEKKRLKMLSMQLTQQDKELIKKEATALHASQEKEENLEVLPKVHLSDVPEDVQTYHLNKEESGGGSLFHHPCFTNGFIYTSFINELPQIEEEELSALRLLTLCIGHVGCGTRDYRKQLEYIQAKTGGIGATLAIYRNVDHPERYTPTLILRGKSLDRNYEDLMTLLYDALFQMRFDEMARFKELILQHYTALEQSLTQSAMRYAINEAQKKLAPSFRLMSAWSGLDYYRYVRQIVQTIDDELPRFIHKAQTLYSTLFQGKKECILTCEETLYQKVRQETFSKFEDSFSHSHTKWCPPFPEYASAKEGTLIASPVAFTCQALPSIPYTHPNAAALSVASQLMENTVLHKRIREQGGAYGSGAVNQASAGSFYFYAYRDPHLQQTLGAFKEGAQGVASGKFSERELEEAKLCVIQGLDAPVSPGARGSVAYTWLREGKSVSVRQQFRERLMQTTKQTVKQVLKEEVLPKLEKSSYHVFSGKELLEREKVSYSIV